ncbi:MAG: BON domain-containing protein [Candidatus Competibacteraceae bacterium]|nr:BON domain-containing protein [Candidatus Competibacteraceae bacterium]MCP5125858.1 BON domain-containing protein [Gammaproteobacteria bacterium]
MRMKWFQLISVVLLALSLNGCAGLLVGGTAMAVSVAHDRRTTGMVVDDQTIEFKLYDALNKKLPQGNRISVTSYNGTVLLTGEVVSETTRWQAENIARHLGKPLVRMVHNELVVGSPISLSVQSNDALLTTKVKTALFQISHIPGFDPTRVKVVTSQGVVYLMGLVRTNEADAAADVASQIGEVRQVVTLFELID